MQSNQSLVGGGDNSYNNSPVISGMTGSNLPSIDCSGSGGGGSSGGGSDTNNISSNKRETTQKFKKCGICTKKIGLTGFICRCGENFCGAHRYPDEHSCTFNYKAMDRNQLEKNLLVGPLSIKLDKI